MARDTFPYWPPSSPQRPANIAGRQSLFVLFDLQMNQVPRDNYNEIPLHPKPLPAIRPPDLPVDPEMESAGRAAGPNLYDLFALTETMTRDQALQMYARLQHG